MCLWWVEVSLVTFAATRATQNAIRSFSCRPVSSVTDYRTTKMYIMKSVSDQSQ
jgi:hypothetical protein